MHRLALILATLIATAATPPPLRLTLAHEAALHCSAVFAVLTADQARRGPTTLGMPAIANRGREYFVVTTARLMDQTGATRGAVSALMRARVAGIRNDLRKSPAPATDLRRLVSECQPLLDAELPGGK